MQIKVMIRKNQLQCIDETRPKQKKTGRTDKLASEKEKEKEFNERRRRKKNRSSLGKAENKKQRRKIGELSLKYFKLEDYKADKIMQELQFKNQKIKTTYIKRASAKLQGEYEKSWVILETPKNLHQNLIRCSFII